MLTVSAGAATLPAHKPISILVVSDGVNPHGLSSAELTEPGEVSAALSQPGAGLSIDGVVGEVSSGCVDEALTALSSDSPPNVLIYFAHQPAAFCAGGDAQPALTTAVETHLLAGGGVVVFHHGLYEATGKESILQLLGASASGVQWDTEAGHRIFRTAREHFISTHQVIYSGEATLAAGPGFSEGIYSFFDNVPDERYPSTTLLEEAGENRVLLFATD
jgi:hypothetical protein